MTNRPPLPPACDTCRLHGGLWVPTENGMSRCDCARGQALAMGLMRYRKFARIEARRQRTVDAGVKATEWQRV